MCGSYQIAIYGHVVGCFLMIEVVKDKPPPNAMCCYSNDRYICMCREYVRTPVMTTFMHTDAEYEIEVLNTVVHVHHRTVYREGSVDSTGCSVCATWYAFLDFLYM